MWVSRYSGRHCFVGAASQTVPVAFDALFTEDAKFVALRARDAQLVATFGLAGPAAGHQQASGVRPVARGLRGRAYRLLGHLTENWVQRNPNALDARAGFVAALSKLTSPEPVQLALAGGRQLDSARHWLESERAFVADAAHELRAPLAAINAQAHLLGTSEEPAARRQALEDLQQGSERVSHPLAQARLESNPAVGLPEALVLAELCRERLAALSWLARTRSIELAFDAPQTPVATFNRAGVVSIVDNRVDNAIRYTPSGRHAEVRLRATDSEIEIQVLDDGPGIAPAHGERVCGRFCRIPGNTELGSGPGLAIVRRIASSQTAGLRLIDRLSGRGPGVMVGLARQRT